MKKCWRWHKFCQRKQSEKENQTPSPPPPPPTPQSPTLLPQNAHVNSITFTKKFALVMLTPLHVCFTWVTVNIDLCKYWRPVILIFVYANIYTGKPYSRISHLWNHKLRVFPSYPLAQKRQNGPKKYMTMGFESRLGWALQSVLCLWCWSWKIVQQ